MLCKWVECGECGEWGKSSEWGEWSIMSIYRHYFFASNVWNFLQVTPLDKNCYLKALPRPILSPPPMLYTLRSANFDFLLTINSY
jgi:hypothetical protein